MLLQEALGLLVTRDDGVYVDATLGGGGHAQVLLERLQSVKLIGIDADLDALEHARPRLERFGKRVTLVNDNFRNLKAVLAGQGLQTTTGVLIDLGVSSFQLDEASKGFSFRSDEMLDMRMNRSQSLNAQAVLNSYEEKTLAEILWKFGEEKLSRRIARRIAQQRNQTAIKTTGELAAIVESVVGQRFLTKSLARVFQAIRIEVNNELENLQRALTDAVGLLEKGGRLVVISYHSLEDRIVKQAFRSASATKIPSGHKLVPDQVISPRLIILTKKPVEASAVEISNNPRARSAKLRAAEKL